METFKTFLSPPKYQKLKIQYENIKQRYVDEIQRLGQPIASRQLTEVEDETETGKLASLVQSLKKFFTM